jgi:hypothetical protein
MFLSLDIDARWAGQARTVMNVLHTLAVFTVHAIVLGSVTVSLDGVEYCVIKVMSVLHYSLTEHMKLHLIILLKLVVKQ